MMLAFLTVLRTSLVGDLFKSGTDLANLGVLGILAAGVIVLGWLHYRSDQREEKRGDALLKLSQDQAETFDRSLELHKTYQEIIREMQSRKRNGDLG